jgi:hypothetical protein
MSCALRVNTATQVKVNIHLLRRGAAKRCWCFDAPSFFAALLAAPFYLAFISFELPGSCNSRPSANDTLETVISFATRGFFSAKADCNDSLKWLSVEPAGMSASNFSLSHHPPPMQPLGFNLA